MIPKSSETYKGKIKRDRLDNLLGDSTPDEPVSNSVSLDKIQLPADQPRRYLDPQALQELVASVKQHGILQPLLVRPIDKGKYELVIGERRYRAARELGLLEVPVVVRELNSIEAWQLALIENLQREDLNPVEETEAILQLLSLKLSIPVESVPKKLRHLFHYRRKALNNVIENTPAASEPESDSNPESVSQALNNIIESTPAASEPESDSNPESVEKELNLVEEVLNGLGLMTLDSLVNNRLPLLNLPPKILEVLRKGEIAYTKAKAIAQVKDDSERASLLKSAIDNHLSLSQIKEQIKNQYRSTKEPKQSDSPNDLSERFTVVARQLKKSRVWSDDAKRPQLETLLAQLEALMLSNQNPLDESHKETGLVDSADLASSDGGTYKTSSAGENELAVAVGKVASDEVAGETEGVEAGI